MSNGLLDYRESKLIGKGSFGDVWLCKCISDGKQYVMKKMDTQDDQSAETEAKLMCQLKHPNVVRYKDFFPNKTSLCLILEYCDGGDLSDKISQLLKHGGSFTEDQVLDWTYDICCGLEYIHKHGIIHRDLKPQNIFLMLPKNMAKIGDFGVSRQLKPGDMATTLTGTPLYISPEIAAGQSYDNKTDVWSLGCCVYELMTLQPAIDPRNLISYGMRVVGTMPSHYTRGLTSLTKQMLTDSPVRRPSIKDILDSSPMQSRQKPPQLPRPTTAGRAAAPPPSSYRPTLPAPRSASNPPAAPSRLLKPQQPLPPPTGILVDLDRTLVASPSSGATAAATPNGSGHEVMSSLFDCQITTPSGINVSVYKGDLSDEKVQAIVSPCDSGISNSGGASRTVAEAAGQPLKDECKQFIMQHRNLPVSHVMSTTCGRLHPPMLYVIHAAGPPPSDFPNEHKLREALHKTFLRCLEHANDELHIASLSIPAISSGTYGVRNEIVADEAYRALMDFDKQASSSRKPRSIRVVNFISLDTDTVKAFVAKFTGKCARS